MDLSGLIEELLKVEGPVRDAATKLLSNFFRDLEIEQGDTLEEKIIEAIDTKTLVESLSGDSAFQAAILKAVKSVIEGADGNHTFVETVETAFGLQDSDKLLETMSDESKKEIANKIVLMIAKHFEGLETDDLDEDTLADIQIAILSTESVDACIKANKEKLAPLILNMVTKVIEGVSAEDSDNDITRQILESPALKKAIDTAVERLIQSGKIEQLVESATETLLKDEGSILNNRLKSAISEKLVDKIAENLVSKLFDRQR